MALADPKLRNLDIKTRVVKRLRKEMKMYEKEVQDQEAKIEKMVAENQDEYNIKKQREVLNESKVMVPDSRRRLEAAVAELQALVDEFSTTEIAEHECFTVAKETLVES